MVASTLLVQADLSGTAFGGAFAPTDVTRFVRLVDGISINSWRQDAASQMSPSTLSLTFDNEALPGDPIAPNAGRFTPGLSTSPWAGRVLPGVRLRITEIVPGPNLLDYQISTGGELLGSTAGYSLYSTGGASLTYSTAAFHAGPGGLVVTSLSTGVAASSFGVRFASGSYRVPVYQGQVVCASAYLFEGATTTAHGTDWTIDVDWFDITGAYLSSAGGQTAQHITLAGAWNRAFTTFVAPAGAVSAQFAAVCTSAIPNTQQVQLVADDFQVELVATGSTPPTTWVPSKIFPLFDGYVLDWTAQPGGDDGTFPVVQVSCTDALGWMGNLQTLRSILEEEVLLDHPTAFYVLNEAQGSTSAGDTSGNNQAAAPVRNSKYGAGTVTFGVDAHPYFASAVTFDSPDVGSVSPNVRASYIALPNTLPNSKPFTIELWFRGPSSPPAIVGADQVLLDAGNTARTPTTPPGVVALVLRNVTGQLQFTVNGTGANPVVLSATSSASLCDGQWHHAAGVLEADGKTIHLYVDGALVGTGANATDIGWAPNPAPITLGLEADTQYAFPFQGAMAAVATNAAALTATRALAHASSAIGYIGESTSAHLARLLQYRPNLGSVLDAGRGAVGVHDTSGATLQQALLDTAKAEGGVVFADGQGRIVLLNRAHFYDPVAAATFDSEADLTSDYQARIDTQLLVNDMTVSRPSGGGQRAVDATSKTTYGWRQQSDTYIVNSDRDAADAAGWLVANQKAAAVRPPSLTIDVTTMTSTSQAQAALARQPLDRVALSNLPTWAPPTDVLIQGRTIRIDDKSLSLSFFTSNVARKTLRAEAVASANTKLDNGLVIPW